MKSERKAALLVISENIEMELFSSEECRTVIQTQDEKGYSSDQTNRDHPLVLDSEEEPEPQVQTQPRKQTKPKKEPPTEKEAKYCPVTVPVPGRMEKVEIEMEVFHPLKVSELVEPKPNKAACLTWKRPLPQMTGLVVKDVVCLPRGHCLVQLERYTLPRAKEQASLLATGVTARISIDCRWSASQMQSRLTMLFWGRFVKRAGQRFSFTYLQCVQGSRVLFVPDTPAGGWTGEQVLRMSEHSALYLLSHLDYPWAQSERLESKTPVRTRKEAPTEIYMDEDKQLRQTLPNVGTTEKVTLDLNTILSLFRKDNVNRDVGTIIHVRRRDLLHSALTEVGRPGFCFRTTPIISFSGEETDGHERPLKEFFRLALLELQQSSVFEGPPGRLIFAYDLTALEDRKYYEAGALIGWSLTQGGPGPRCLHPALYQLMCGQNPSLEDFSWSDIVDAEAQTQLQELHSCTDVMLLSNSLRDWVSSCGIPGIHLAHSDEIPAIYRQLVKHYIYHRVASMISQFKEGLDSCGGLWNMVQSHWEMFVPVMTSVQQQPLTLEEFKQLFTINYSQSGSQLREAEEGTARHWETVLALVRDGRADFSFNHLLAFITGADHLPPLGFPGLISLRFYSQDASMSYVRLPYTSTCALELFLPRGVAGAADLLMLLSRAVHEALGYTHLQKEEHEEDKCIQIKGL